MIMKTKLNKINKISLISIAIYSVFLISIPIYGNGENLKINQFYQIANSMIDSNELQAQNMQGIQEQSKEQMNTEEKKESNLEIIKKENQEQSREYQNIESQQFSKKNVDECAQILLTGDKVVQLAVIATCASENQDNEKMQDALLKVIENSDDDKVIMSSLLLLSNKKKDKISESLINLINNNKFNSSSMQSYSAILVLYSSLSSKYKAQGKEIFNNYSTSEDELLKHLSEQLSKKN